ncbi:MAG: rRNA maturation RNase YbeY [Gemmatimonadetes bacterium]|nr:rRNA maturation RNase YbeY [Gemmatimonadota bacterium]
MSGVRDLDVQVSVGDGEPLVDASLLEAAVRRTWRAEGRGAGEVSVTLLDDEAIAELNRTYLDRDGPTDVIAFAMGDAAVPVGDVYLGADQAARQAGEYGVALAEELVRLTVHGTLHVLGYDHPDGPERVTSPMFVRQEALVRVVLEESDLV